MPHRSELRWGITSVRFGTVSAGHLRPRRTAIVPPAATIANAPRPAARAAVLSDCGATRSVSTFGPAVEVEADEVGIGDVVVEVGAGVVVVLVGDGDVLAVVPWLYLGALLLAVVTSWLTLRRYLKV